MSEPTPMGLLAAALAAAQGEMRAAAKTAKNPHLGSKFADLASCWDAIRVPLASNGLAVVQLASVEVSSAEWVKDEKGRPARQMTGLAIVETRLLHAGGGEVAGRLALPWESTKGLTAAQTAGVAVTYARRYGLMALVGIAAEDFDGAPPKPKRVEPKATDTREPTPARTHDRTWEDDRPGYCAELGRIGWTYGEVVELLEWRAASGGRKMVRPSGMTVERRNELLDWLAGEQGKEARKAWLAATRPTPAPTPEPELAPTPEPAPSPAPAPAPTPGPELAPTPEPAPSPAPAPAPTPEPELAPTPEPAPSPAPAPAPTQAQADPGADLVARSTSAPAPGTWDADRETFIAAIAAMEWNYESMCLFLASLGKPVPSAMTAQQRATMLAWMGSSAGKAKITAWRDAQAGADADAEEAQP